MSSCSAGRYQSVRLLVDAQQDQPSSTIDLQSGERFAPFAIAGTVAAALVTPGCSPQVYIFTGAGVLPDDQDTAPHPDVDPLVSAPVNLDTATAFTASRSPPTKPPRSTSLPES